MIGGSGSGSLAVWLQRDEYVKTLIISYTAAQVSKIVVATNKDAVHEFGLNARGAQSTEFAFDDEYSLIGFMGSSSGYAITSLSAIRSVDCAVLAAELEAEKAEFSLLDDIARNGADQTSHSGKETNTLGLVAILVLAVAVIALSAAFIACLVQRSRDSQLATIYAA